MDRARSLEYLQSNEGVEELDAQLDHARQLGIRAVPSFVIDGRYLVEGAQSAETFLQVLEEISAAGQSTPTASSAACEDGSCAV